MGARCLCGLLFLIKTCEAHLVQEIGKGSTANVQCTFTNNLYFWLLQQLYIYLCYLCYSSLIHDSLSRAKVIWKQHILKGASLGLPGQRIQKGYLYLTFQGICVGQHSPFLKCLFCCLRCHLLKKLTFDIFCKCSSGIEYYQLSLESHQ